MASQSIMASGEPGRTVAGSPIESLTNRLGPQFNTALQAAVPNEDLELWRMLRYHMGWCNSDGKPGQASAGKQVRPLLVFLAMEASGGTAARATPFAVAVELLHNFSLIHDDIEDGSRERRHRATLWDIWGEPQAINAGDALHVLARRALFDAPDLPAQSLVEAAHLFDETSLELCRGQFLDMSFERRSDVTATEYVDMIRGKTAALIGASLELGVLAAGGDAEQRRQARSAGIDLGIAFQIHDDILGIWGAPERTGKSASSDIVNRKKTYPILHALEHSAEATALRAMFRDGPLSETAAAEVLCVLDRAGARETSSAFAHQQRDRGLATLDTAFGANASVLRTLAMFLTDRDF